LNRKRQPPSFENQWPTGAGFHHESVLSLSIENHSMDSAKGKEKQEVRSVRLRRDSLREKCSSALYGQVHEPKGPGK
jgi:hypothetical protein